MIETWEIVHGKKDGVNILYNDFTGSIARKSYWRKNLPIDTEYFFQDNFMDKTNEYKDGQLKCRTVFYPNGKIKSISDFSYGKLESVEAFDEYGQVILMDEN